jgi:uncharacterized protein YdeI (YjbR/CyaY-like superfamily)
VLPEPLRRAFQARPLLAERWHAENLALRRQIIRYIEQAKTPETLARRCDIFVERLSETGGLRRKDS